MSKATIEKSKLLSFLKLITLKNDLESKDALITVAKDKLSTLLVSSDRSVALQGELKVEGLTDLGDVGLNNLPEALSVVEAMGDEIKIEFVKNKFEITDKKTKVSMVLSAPDYVMNKLEPEKFKGVMSNTQNGLSFTLPQATLKEIVTKFNSVKSADLTLSGKKGKLYLYVKNYQNETEMTHDLSVDVKGDFEFKIGSQFIDLISLIETDLLCELASSNPSAVALSFSTETQKFRYLLALIAEEAPEVKNTETRKPAKAKKDTANV